MEQELDIKLAVQYAASASNALRAFEWAFQVLGKAQALEAELEIQEKKVEALKDANAAAKHSLDEAQSNLKKTQATVTTKLRDLDQELQARIALADKTVKDKLAVLAEQEAAAKVRLDNFEASVEEKKKTLTAEVDLLRGKLKVAQDEYNRFLEKLKVV